MSKNRNVGFTVSGEFITEHAHELVLSKQWRSAIEFLQTGIIGISMEYIIPVLTGDKKFVGNNKVEYVDDNDEEYKNSVKFLYAGLIEEYGVGYIPYMVVNSYNGNDMGFFDSRNPVGSRARYYKEKDDDRIEMCDVTVNGLRGSHAVIFSKIENYPFWIDKIKGGNDKWQKSVDEYIDVHRYLQLNQLEPCEAFQQVSEQKQKVEIESESAIIEKEKKYLKDSLIVDHGFGCTGWLLTDGSFYQCGYTEHRYLAELILRYVYDVKPTDIEQQMESMNALKFQQNLFKSDKFDVLLLPTQRYTNIQKTIAYEWCEQHGLTRKYFDFFKD